MRTLLEATATPTPTQDIPKSKLAKANVNIKIKVALAVQVEPKWMGESAILLRGYFSNLEIDRNPFV